MALLLDRLINSLARRAIASPYLSLNQFVGTGVGDGVVGGSVGGSVGGGGGGPHPLSTTPTPTTSSSNGNQYLYFRRFFPPLRATITASGASSHSAGFCKGAYGFSVRGL